MLFGRLEACSIQFSFGIPDLPGGELLFFSKGNRSIRPEPIPSIKTGRGYKHYKTWFLQATNAQVLETALAAINDMKGKKLDSKNEQVELLFILYYTIFSADKSETYSKFLTYNFVERFGTGVLLRDSFIISPKIIYFCQVCSTGTRILSKKSIQRVNVVVMG